VKHVAEKVVRVVVHGPKRTDLVEILDRPNPLLFGKLIESERLPERRSLRGDGHLPVEHVDRFNLKNALFALHDSRTADETDWTHPSIR